MRNFLSARLLRKPTASDGEKMPPGMPLTVENVVARNLNRPKSPLSGVPPSSAVFTWAAGLGANVAHLFPTAPVAPVILLGMVSYFAGVVQAPITAFVIVTEMTDNHAMVIPLMAAAMIGYGASKLVCPEGIYHALAKGFAHPR